MKFFESIRKLSSVVLLVFLIGYSFMAGSKFMSWKDLKYFYQVVFYSSLLDFMEGFENPESLEVTNLKAILVDDRKIVFSGFLSNKSSYTWVNPDFLVSFYVDSLLIKQCKSSIEFYKLFEKKESVYIEFYCSGFQGGKIPDSLRYDIKITKAYRLNKIVDSEKLYQSEK